MNSSQNRNPRQLVAALTRAASRVSRRSLLTRLGLRAAALVGVSFGVARIIETALRPSPLHAATGAEGGADPGDKDEKKPCTHPDQCGPAGAFCGMSGYSCEAYSRCTDCPSAQADGCPQGTTKQAVWVACCMCSEERPCDAEPPLTRSGQLTAFWDCCGDASKPRNGVDVMCSDCYKQAEDRCEHPSCGGQNDGVRQNWCTNIVLGVLQYVCTTREVLQDCTITCPS